MLSVNLTICRNFLLALTLFSFSSLRAQENSPFSSHGLGDIYPQQNIASRGMGGVAVGLTSSQVINTLNPASYGFLKLVTFDVGISIDQRTLKQANPAETYTSANFLPSYVVLGTPLNSAKGWGLAFGFKPLTRINYSVQAIQKTSVDSLQTLFQGTGGLTQAFIGIGKTFWPDLPAKPSKFTLALGFNAGYEFGRKQTDSIFNYHDTVIAYSKSDYSRTTTYTGYFFNPGIMASLKLFEHKDKITNIRQTYKLTLGASATFQHQLNASTNTIVQSFDYDANGAIVPIDTIKMQNSVAGKITVPVNYTAGFMLSEFLPDFAINKWSLGVDYSASKWSDYRFYGQQDQVNDSWMLHAGGEFTPDPFAATLFSRATYRAGFYTGKDYINADGNGYNVKAFTVGLGFALKKFRGNYDHQYTIINTALEFSKRGDTKNNVTENFFKLSVGFSLSDIWFIKRKYD